MTCIRFQYCLSRENVQSTADIIAKGIHDSRILIMKNIFLLVSIMILFLSCNRDFYGTYTTNYSEDKSSFFQIRLNVDNTVEKTEVHTIRDFAKGKFIIKENEVVCFLDSSTSKFPPDTLSFKLKRRKLYFLRNGVLNKNSYLVKE